MTWKCAWRVSLDWLFCLLVISSNESVKLLNLRNLVLSAVCVIHWPLLDFLLSLYPLLWTLTAVAAGPGLGPIPMSQFGTISRQISRHNSNTSSSVSMVSATGTYRRAPSVSSQFSMQQPHVNGGTNASKTRRTPHEYTDTFKLTSNWITHLTV